MSEFSTKQELIEHVITLLRREGYSYTDGKNLRKDATEVFLLIINHKCDMYNQKFCRANKLLLSKKVYESEEREHLLHLWLGCEEFLTNYNLIAFAPLLNVLEIPYSYCLIKEHFNHLIKNIPSATTSSRTITLSQLRNIDFQIHPTKKIIEFNRTCEPIFEYQQALEEEIYKLRKLLEKEEEIINKKIFTRKLN